MRRREGTGDGGEDEDEDEEDDGDANVTGLRSGECFIRLAGYAPEELGARLIPCRFSPRLLVNHEQGKQM